MTNPKAKESTTSIILKAAEKIFEQKGFEAASTLEIAKKAGLNKSLIFHHFKNKESLWKAVKANLLEEHTGKNLEQIVFPTNSFKAFLRSFITFRFELYENNPTLSRLISWQRLEKSKDEIEGVGPKDSLNLISHIKEFQEVGEVRANLDPEMVSYFIMTSTSMPFMDVPDFFKNSKNAKQQYLEMLIEGNYLAFATQNKDLSPRAWTI